MLEIDLKPVLEGEPAPKILDDRIWVDGCWDFFHHGHAGAILQARQLGTELYVGVHSDESILENKGPTVMTLEERIIAVNACKWVTCSISHAPYVTSLPWITHYGCKYVVHGDDITSDSDGQDCYRYVKAAGRFKVVKRTPSISTTDLVERILLGTRTHFIKALDQHIEDEENNKSKNEGIKVKKLIQAYATDETGLNASSSVWHWKPTEVQDHSDKREGNFTPLSQIINPKPGQRIIYVDGGFDLFSSGHIEFLRLVIETEVEISRKKGWYSELATQKRIMSTGSDYPPTYVVAGIHNDESINQWKGSNYPIMNIVERGLCVLQCKYINSVVLGAPITISNAYLESIPCGTPCAVYHGPQKSNPRKVDQYLVPKEMGIYHEIPQHAYSSTNATSICQRIFKSRDLYEERQRVKALKSINEQSS